MEDKASHEDDGDEECQNSNDGHEEVDGWMVVVTHGKAQCWNPYTSVSMKKGILNRCDYRFISFCFIVAFVVGVASVLPPPSPRFPEHAPKSLKAAPATRMSWAGEASIPVCHCCHHPYRCCLPRPAGSSIRDDHRVLSQQS